MKDLDQIDWSGLLGSVAPYLQLIAASQASGLTPAQAAYFRSRAWGNVTDAWQKQALSNALLRWLHQNGPAAASSDHPVVGTAEQARVAPARTVTATPPPVKSPQLTPPVPRPKPVSTAQLNRLEGDTWPSANNDASLRPLPNGLLAPNPELNSSMDPLFSQGFPVQPWRWG